MQLDLAVAHQDATAAIADRAANRAVLAWRRGMTSDFDTSWAGISGQVARVVTAGQMAAAASANAYLARTARADHMTDPSAGDTQPAAWAGVDGSGRTLDGLMYTSVTAAKTAIGAGAGLQQALTVGATVINTMAHTAVFDTGRSADLTAMTARKYTYYVRVVSAGACSRCAILAGSGSAKEPFLRHPRCRCSAAPVTGVDEVPKSGKYASPAEYFESLTKGEQDRVFTNAGAEAIRAGADPIAVVNARSKAPGIDYSSRLGGTSPNSGRVMVRSVIGHNPDGTPVLGYTTGQGTSRRGAFGKQQRSVAGYTKRIRVMPETIIRLTDDVELRQVLLRDAGYLTLTPTAVERSAALGGTFFARQAALIREDRAVADAFYASHHISLG